MLTYQERVTDLSSFPDKRIAPSWEAVSVVSDVVAQGGVIVFPWGKLERRCFGLMGDSRSLDACARMNGIKQRAADQVLAVNGYPGLIAEVAKIENSRPLMQAAERLRIDPIEVLRECMRKGAISFIFEARDNLPPSVVSEKDGRKTVMIAGEIDDTGFDFYNALIHDLHRKGIITSGTSANRTKEGTYHLFQQETAYQDLGSDVDLFVYHRPLPRRPLYALNLESCTTFDMTVDGDTPEASRLGSSHPVRFQGIFGGFTIAYNAKLLPHREHSHQIWLKESLRRLDRLAHAS